ncbi:MAG TPA: hypothetical protein VHB21_05000 [Minicystis sp.]|nr:hypothetical protein [Minicystis sp.]
MRIATAPSSPCPRGAAPRASVVGIALATALLFSSGAARADAPPKLDPILRFPPKLLPYDEGAPVPPGYHVETRPTKSYLLGGASLFGASYLVSAVIAATVVAARQPDASRVAPLAIPVAGPFVTLATAHAGVPGGVVLAVDGIAQTAGAILFVSGFYIPEKVLVFDTLPAVTARLVPGPGTLALRGTF